MNYKKLRQLLGLSPSEFGRLLGFGSPQVRVSELENGKKNGSPQLQRFCTFLEYLVENGEKQRILDWWKAL